MDDRIMQAAVRAYEYASNDDDSVSYQGLRAAVSRALEIQREEIAAEIEAKATEHARTACCHGTGECGLDDCRADSARADALGDAVTIAREHGKES